MTRPLLLLATLATSTRAWPRLDAALANYPSIHARETARLKAGDASAKFVLVVCYHTAALVTSHSARPAAVLESQRTTTWTTSAATVAAAARARSRRKAMLRVPSFRSERQSSLPCAFLRARRHDVENNVEIIERVESPVNPALTAC